MDRQTVTRARWAVTAVFFVNGSLLASYLARIPSIKLEHRLDDGELGVVLTLFGASSLFRVSALVAVAGLTVVLVVPTWPTAILGFAILGLGASVLLPLIYSAVGHAGGADAATSLSRFTTFTYAGILVGPAVVGWFAEAVGLTWTLAGLLPLLLTVAANSRLMSRSTTPVRE